MTELTFRLPMPPSVNKLFRSGVKGRRFKSQDYRAWLKEAMEEIMAQRVSFGPCQAIQGRYHLLLEFERCRCDLGNLEKAVSDALVKMHVIPDDKFAEEITLRWADVSGCRVTVRPAT